MDNINVHPFAGNDKDTDILLFFTDNHNEPRRINVRRAIEGNDYEGNALGYEGEDLEDFITACAKVPEEKIDFEFITEYANGNPLESNFKEIDGIVFSYQNVYVDGFVSALAPFSTVAFPPAVAGLGIQSLSDVIVENLCQLTIPKQSKEVAEVRILFKVGDDGVWKIIDEVNTTLQSPNFELSDADNVLGTYYFRNDKAYAVLAADESTKNYDRLPKKAQSQSIAGNRVMYGNYVEGFDNVNASADATVAFIERPRDLISFTLDVKPMVISNDNFDGNVGASAGFEIDGTGLPDSLEEGFYHISINLKPSRNIHLYSTSNGSFRGSKNISDENGLGFNAQLPAIELLDTDGLLPNLTSDDVGINSVQATPMFRGGAGVGIGLWVTDSVQFTTSLGTTPCSPVILDINSVLLDIKFQINQGSITRETLMFILHELLTANSANPISTLQSNNIELISINGEAQDVTNGVFVSEQIDVGLSSGDRFDHETSYAELICAIQNNTTDPRPGGFIIINKANVKIGFESVSSYNFDSSDGLKKAIRIKVVGLDTEEILTCLPKPAIGQGRRAQYAAGFSSNTGLPPGYYSNHEAQPWIVSGGNQPGPDAVLCWPYVDTELVGGYNVGFEIGTALLGDKLPFRIGEWKVFNGEDLLVNEAWQDWYSVELTGIAGTNFVSAIDIDQDSRTFSFSNIGSVMRYIPNFDGDDVAVDLGFQNSPSRNWGGIMTNFSFAFDELNPDNENYVSQYPPVKQTLSVVDGDVGPGGRRDASSPFSSETVPFFAPGQSNEIGPLWTTFKHNRWGSIWSTSLVGYVENLPFLDAGRGYVNVSSSENQSSTDPIKNGAFESSPLDNISIVTSLAGGVEVQQSFKTRATHDFGIVYYDKRGRASAVNPLASVYVPGYSNTERPGITSKGAAYIFLNITHNPPEGAYSYRLVRSDRSSVSNFIQYSTSGAFVKKGPSSDKNKIYVSLNHLQGHDISYSDSYGARSQDTDEPTLYRFTPGDKLRVLSYYSDDDTRVWVNDNVVFDVVGVETLSDSLEDHPLYAESETNTDTKARRNGEFVVLRDNENANGFSALDVNGNSDLWGNRVVFEIISPNKGISEEAVPYFELPHKGLVQDGSHTPGTHAINEGDVFFRGVAMNVQAYDSSSNEFVDLVDTDAEGNDTSQSRFRIYHLETRGLTDLHRSVAKAKGKVHFVDPEARQIRRDSSIAFSSKTATPGLRPKYSSFHPLEQNSFDLPEKYGATNYLVGKDEYVTAIQESKVSMIPLDRAITANLSGKSTLNLSDEVLNSAAFFEQDYGSANNPESVVVVDGLIYFADKNNKMILSVSKSKGMEVISQNGMEERFERQFEALLESSDALDYSDIRIVSGYDPDEGEVLFSFIKPERDFYGLDGGLGTEFETLGQVSPLNEFLDNPSEPFINTIAFDHKGGKFWKTRYSFSSTNYARVNNQLISFFEDPNIEGFVWRHNQNESRNRFYGTRYSSMIKMASTMKDASSNKEFRALSFEGNQAWPSILKTTDEKAKVESFNKLEGGFYSSIGGSEGKASTSNVMTVGIVKGFSYPQGFETSLEVATALAGGEEIFVDVEFEGQVNRYPINIGNLVSVIGVAPGQTEAIDLDLTSTQIIDSHTIRYRVNSSVAIYSGFKIIHVANGAIYGDTLRDKALVITAYNDSEEPVELFALNVESTLSKLDASS